MNFQSIFQKDQVASPVLHAYYKGIQNSNIMRKDTEMSIQNDEYQQEEIQKL
jgi:hypothetical protein